MNTHEKQHFKGERVITSIQTYEYDALNRLTKITNPLGEITTFLYDAKGRRTGMTQHNGVTTAYSFDDANRLLSLVSQIGATNVSTFSYTYDNRGNRTSMTDKDGIQTYEYDALNRLTKITNPFGEVTTYSYDAIGRRTGMTQHNGVETTYSYDGANRILSLVSQIGVTNINAFSYTYNKVGNRTSMTDNEGVHNYVYDQLQRLINATHPQPENPAENFNYDSVGNRTDSHLSTTYTVDNMNRLLEDENFIYTHDANGNTTQMENKATGEVDNYTFDSENKLTAYEKYPSIGAAIPTTQGIYNYDGMGRRIAKSVDGALIKFIYDGENVLLDLDSNDQVIARYTRPFQIDDVISVNRDTNGDGGFDAAYYYHKDALGSVFTITDTSGSVVENYVYDSFGRIVGAIGGVVNRYTYTARELDQESDLYYYRARHYNSQIGRFLSEDPVGFMEGVNFYAYVQSNPVNLIDPLGLCSECGWECNTFTWKSPWATVSTTTTTLDYKLLDSNFFGHFIGSIKCYWQKKMKVDTIEKRKKYTKVICTEKCTGEVREGEYYTTVTNRTSEITYDDHQNGGGRVGTPPLDNNAECKANYRPGG